VRWATTEVYAFVLYCKRRTTQSAGREVRAWTREMIDAVLEEGGRGAEGSERMPFSR
jgi:hypothetical protein